MTQAVLPSVGPPNLSKDSDGPPATVSMRLTFLVLSETAQ